MNEPLFPEPSIEGVLHYLEHVGWFDLQESPPEAYGVIQSKGDGYEITDFRPTPYNRLHTIYYSVKILSLLDIPITNAEDLCEDILQMQDSKTGFFSARGKKVSYLDTTFALETLNTLNCKKEYKQKIADYILEYELNDALYDFKLDNYRQLKRMHPISLLNQLTEILILADNRWEKPEWIISEIEKRKGKYGFYYEGRVDEEDLPIFNRAAVPAVNTGSALHIMYLLQHTPKNNIKKILKNYEKQSQAPSYSFMLEVHRWFNLAIPKPLEKKVLDKAYKHWNPYRGGFKSEAHLPVSNLGSTAHYIEELSKLGIKLQ